MLLADTMASRAFQDAILQHLNNVIDLHSGTADAHLVTADPGSSADTGADLTSASGGNYAIGSVTLTTPTTDGSGAAVRCTASTITWVQLWTAAATPITGVAFTKRAGGSYASTDKLFAYIEFTSSFTPPTSLPASGNDLVFTIPSTGLVKGTPA